MSIKNKKPEEDLGGFFLFSMGLCFIMCIIVGIGFEERGSASIEKETLNEVCTKLAGTNATFEDEFLVQHTFDCITQNATKIIIKTEVT